MSGATLGQALRAATARLAQAGVEGAARDATLLLAHGLGIEPMHVPLEAGRVLTRAEEATIEALIARRAGREPVSKIIGTREFWGRSFRVTADVLDPRPDTETLIELALAGPQPERLLDLGTGTGIIPITLLSEWPEARGVACDISEAALAVARENAASHGVKRLELILSDWFDGVEGRFDLITSNPPYISAEEMETLAPEVHDHDPHLALTPGGDGLEPYRVIARQTVRFLTPNGRLLLEIGHLQGPDVAQILRNHGFRAVDIHPDLAGKDRIVSALAPEN